MANSIDSYVFATPSGTSLEDDLTVREFGGEANHYLVWSILFRPMNYKFCGYVVTGVSEFNAKISALQDNWDDEGSPAITETVKASASEVINMMEVAGEKLYSFAPGPAGEVMLDYRNQGKSLEIILYPDKKNFVKFSDNEDPHQGKFDVAILPSLITWLND